MASIRQRLTTADDIWYTPVHALHPILPFLEKGSAIWEPACGTGNLVDALHELGYRVVGTDIATGYDFLTTLLKVRYDYIVTNPPFSLKNEFLQRCYWMRKPFALLLPVSGLESARRQRLFRNGLELILFPSLISFGARRGEFGQNPHRAVAWFTNGLNIAERQHLLPDGYELLKFEKERYMTSNIETQALGGLSCFGCDRAKPGKTSEVGVNKEAICTRCYMRLYRKFGADAMSRMEHPGRIVKDMDDQEQRNKSEEQARKTFSTLMSIAGKWGFSLERRAKLIQQFPTEFADLIEAQPLLSFTFSEHRNPVNAKADDESA
jgi:hypothetical protein